MIELKIDNLDDLFPSEPANGQGFGYARPTIRRGFVQPFGNDPSQWPIQVLTSTGQSIFYQTSIDRDSGGVTLRLNQMPQMGEAKEIRISSIIRASAKIPFEFMTSRCLGFRPVQQLGLPGRRPFGKRHLQVSSPGR